jgi:hypothetical protein
VNLPTCETIRAPNAAITKKVMSIVIAMPTTLFIFFRTKKFTTGWSTIAKMTAKTTGTIISFAMYRIVVKAHKPMTKIDAFA